MSKTGVLRCDVMGSAAHAGVFPELWEVPLKREQVRKVQSKGSPPARVRPPCTSSHVMQAQAANSPTSSTRSALCSRRSKSLGARGHNGSPQRRLSLKRRLRGLGSPAVRENPRPPAQRQSARRHWQTFSSASLRCASAWTTTHSYSFHHTKSSWRRELTWLLCACSNLIWS